jgi:hypothetical protein
MKIEQRAKSAKERRAKSRRFLPRNYRVEIKLIGAPIYQFRVQNVSSDGAGILIKEDSKFLSMIEAGISVDSLPKCWRRPNRKPCKGTLVIQLDPATDQIHWICPICEDEGGVTGWKGLIWDMSDPPSYFQ